MTIADSGQPTQQVCSIRIKQGFALAALFGLTSSGFAYLGYQHGIRAEMDTAVSALLPGSLQVVSSTPDLSALTARLAQMQAELISLRTLGDQLRRQARLNADEFNFSPGGNLVDRAIGGALPAVEMHASPLPRLGSSLASVARQIRQHALSFDVLGDLLLQRQISLQTVPSGAPLDHVVLSSGYGRRIDPFTGAPDRHAGIDLEGARGTPIKATGDGVVVFVGRLPGYGNLIDIDHGNGYLTRYAHNARNLVRIGARVRRGDAIALVGATGRVTGSHLHYEIHHNGQPINPMPLLAGTP